MSDERCSQCGRKMILKEEKVVNGTTYYMYRCEDCKRIVAKSSE